VGSKKQLAPRMALAARDHLRARATRIGHVTAPPWLDAPARR
jgi:hypothetical protein